MKTLFRHFIHLFLIGLMTLTVNTPQSALGAMRLSLVNLQMDEIVDEAGAETSHRAVQVQLEKQLSERRLISALPVQIVALPHGKISSISSVFTECVEHAQRRGPPVSFVI